jgi:mRNA-degrading endonuclease toxin of MazEF toxin-antitoxin module
VGRSAQNQPGAVSVANDAYSYLSKLIVVEITSTVRGIASKISLGETEGVTKVCVANCDSLRMAPRTSLTKCAGRLAQMRETEVKRAMGPLWDGVS